MSRKKINTKTLGIVIPVFNGYEYLHKCLEALPEACGDIPYKVYVVDNGSDKKARREFWATHSVDDLEIHNNPLGFPGACNLGAEKANSSTYLLFLNSDAVMLPGSIQIMVEKMKSDQKIGILGAKLLFPPKGGMGEGLTVQHAGIDFDVFGRAVHTFIGWPSDNPKVNVAEEVEAVTGACLLIRKNIFDKAGGFFVAYGVGTWEDVDLCLTVRSMDYIIYYEPNAIGYHYVGASARENKFSYPLNQNAAVFEGRWGHIIKNQKWRMWTRL